MGKMIRLTNKVESQLAKIHNKPIKAISILLDDSSGLNEVQKKEVILIIQDELYKARQGY